MNSKDIRALSPEEVVTKLRETRAQLLQMNLRRHTGQVEKTHEFRELRRTIARLETIRTEKAKA
jgi:large subunit ribosomal protein L29